MSVHAKGTIRFLDDEALIDALRTVSMYFENNNPDSPTVFDNLPPALTQKLMKAIVAFEIEVKEMDHVFKLSQDRDEKSYGNIIERLRQQGESGQVIADEMEKRWKDVFPQSGDMKAQSWNKSVAKKINGIIKTLQAQAWKLKIESSEKLTRKPISTKHSEAKPGLNPLFLQSTLYQAYIFY